MACTGHIVDSLLSVEQTTDLDAADVDTTVTHLGPKLPWHIDKLQGDLVPPHSGFLPMRPSN